MEKIIVKKETKTNKMAKKVNCFFVWQSRDSMMVELEYYGRNSNGFSEIIDPSFWGSGPGSGTGSGLVGEPFGTGLVPVRDRFPRRRLPARFSL